MYILSVAAQLCSLIQVKIEQLLAVLRRDYHGKVIKIYSKSKSEFNFYKVGIVFQSEKFLS